MDVDGPGTAYGPAGVGLDLERSVADATGKPVELAVQLIGAAVTDASRRHPNLVSLDWDSVLVGPGGAGPVRAHRQPRQVVVPRH
jgi:hypothetical protein